MKVGCCSRYGGIFIFSCNLPHTIYNVMRKLLFVLAAAGITAFTAQSCKTMQKPANTDDADLITEMTLPSTVKAGDPIMVTFTVKNPGSKDQQFLKWQTPFEGFLNDFLDIRNPAGELLEYHGPMVKRLMPPPAESFITVGAGQQQTGSTDITKVYRIKLPGTYTVEYTGTSMSGLKKVNKAAFTVVQ